MSTRFAVLFAVVAIAMIPSSSRAQEGPAPVGRWSGIMENGNQMITIVIERDGRFFGEEGNSGAVSGQWRWQSTNGGGFLTLTYRNGRTDTFSASYLGGSTMNLARGNMWVTLRRQ